MFFQFFFKIFGNINSMRRFFTTIMGYLNLLPIIFHSIARINKNPILELIFKKIDTLNKK